MIGLIFCQIVISGELIALMAALGVAAAASLTFIGSLGDFLGDAIVTAFAAVTLVGSAVAACPAALTILLALGLTLPFKIRGCQLKTMINVSMLLGKSDEVRHAHIISSTA